MLLPLTRGAKPQEVHLDDRQGMGTLSPNGKWIVYQSNAGSGSELILTSFTGQTGKWPISEDGGILARWSGDGREIFYLKPDHATMYGVRVSEKDGVLHPSKPERLFTTQMLLGRGFPYDVSHDGQRFLAVVSSGSTTAPLTVVVDWPSEVRR